MNDEERSAVLVTGATGFVGQALCRRLEKEGVPLTRALRRPVAEGLAKAGDIVVGEIGPETPWVRALTGVRAIVHLAAHVHQMASTAQTSAKYHEVNTAGTTHLARQAGAAGVQRFIFLSSVKVNGESTAIDRCFTEMDIPDPQDDYGRSKWLAEQGLHEIASANGMSVTILRPPLVYGPGVRANFLALLGLAASGLPLPFGSIKNLRSFIFVENLVGAIMLALHRSSPGIGTYLISDGQDLSTPDLVARCRREFGVARRLPCVPVAVLKAAGRILGMNRQLPRLIGSLRVDSSLAAAQLGWRPQMKVDDSIRQTCEWFRDSGRGRPNRREK